METYDIRLSSALFQCLMGFLAQLRWTPTIPKVPVTGARWRVLIFKWICLENSVCFLLAVMSIFVYIDRMNAQLVMPPEIGFERTRTSIQSLKGNSFAVNRLKWTRNEWRLVFEMCPAQYSAFSSINSPTSGVMRCLPAYITRWWVFQRHWLSFVSRPNDSMNCACHLARTVKALASVES